MPNLERALNLLEKVGFAKFLAEVASTAPLLLLTAPEDVARLRAFAPQMTVQSWAERNRAAEPPGTLAIDCCIPGREPHPDAPVSLFSDVLAAFLCGTKELSRNPVTGRRYYLISTPRSGSTFLCSLLSSTRRLGRPTEHFKAWLTEYLPAVELSFTALLDKLHKYSATSNGVFGTKIIINDLFALLGGFQEEIMAELQRSEVFLLLRADKGAQALSNVRSTTFSLYHVTGNDPALSDLRTKSLEVDIEAVFQGERWLLRQEADLVDLLQERGIQPHIISYEAAVQSRTIAACVLGNIAGTLGTRLDEGFVWPRLVRLSANLPPEMQLNYERFRAGAALYSARSEPWLQNVLVSGWGKVARWGVVAQENTGTAAIHIPESKRARFFELLFHIGPNSPSTLTVAGINQPLPRPESGSRKLRWIGRLPPASPERGVIELAYGKGWLGLEEVVFYDELPPTVAARLEGNAVLIPS